MARRGRLDMTNDFSDYVAQAEALESMSDEQLNKYVDTFVKYYKEDGGKVGEKCKDFIANNPVPIEEDQIRFLKKVQELTSKQKEETTDE